LGVDPEAISIRFFFPEGRVKLHDTMPIIDSILRLGTNNKAGFEEAELMEIRCCKPYSDCRCQNLIIYHDY
jgi:hypothetical protein